MKDIAIQERIRLIEKEMDILGDAIEDLKMDLKEQLAGLTIELGTLKTILTQLHPEFKTEFPRIKKIVTSQIDPDRLK